MNIKKLTLSSPDYPEILRHITSPPPQLYVRGADLTELLKRPCVAIVGTRKMSPYGNYVTAEFAGKLAEQGMVIISGLAFGVDALAHRSALEAGGTCIAVLPSPVDNIVPVSHRRLAQRILDQGGAVVSEYEPGMPALRQQFIARNRIMSGLADVVLITEAGEKSGALYTAHFANDQNKAVLAVPGNINAQGYAGSNTLLKRNEAGAVTNYKDVLEVLQITPHATKVREVKGRNAHEQKVLDLLLQGISDGDKLLEQSGLDISHFNQALTMLEIGDKIRPLGLNHWALT